MTLADAHTLTNQYSTMSTDPKERFWCGVDRPTTLVDEYYVCFFCILSIILCLCVGLERGGGWGWSRRVGVG